MKLPVLETAHLRMRPYLPGDVDALHALFGDPEVRRYLFDDEVWPRALVEQEIASNLVAFQQRGWGQWALELLATHRGSPADEARPAGVVGFCGFREFFDPPQLQLLYGLAPTVWGRGLATEAARAACDYGFLECGFERILAATDVPNLASVEVMKRLGMRFVEESSQAAGPTVFYALDRPQSVSPSYRRHEIEVDTG
jgi:ribosomal-protein-alanine N-acetyltransferase